MKRYLLVGIAVLFVSANASLKEDFAQMDLEENQLLSQMRNASSLHDDIDVDEETDTLDSDTDEETVSVSEKVEKDTIEDSNETVSQSREETILKNATEEVKEKEKDTASDKLALIKEEMEAIDTAFEKSKEARLNAEIASKKAEIIRVKEAEEKLAKAQREAEKRDVEAYEKKRAEKLAKEAAKKATLEKKQLAEKAAKKAALEKKLLAQKAIEEKAKQAKVKASSKTPSGEKMAKESTSEGVETTVGDVNITRELEEATKIANAEYEKAVKEMQEED